MSDSTTERNLSDTARAICRYLDAHPRAADSLDGILRWWLTRQRVSDSESEVQTALNELVASGQISHRRLPDGTVVYQRQTTLARNDGTSAL